jgi:hypothetical protein
LGCGGDGGDDGGDEVSFAPYLIYNEAPAGDQTTDSAFIAAGGTTFTSTYGMPLFEYYDTAGTLLASEYATSVTTNSSGSSATGPMPSDLTQFYPGVYIGLALNANTANVYSVIGEGAVQIVAGTGQDGGGGNGCGSKKVC